MNQTPPPDFSSSNSGQPAPQPSNFMPAPRRVLPTLGHLFHDGHLRHCLYRASAHPKTFLAPIYWRSMAKKINAAIVAGELWRLVTPIWAACVHLAHRLQHVCTVHLRPRLGKAVRPRALPAALLIERYCRKRILIPVHSLRFRWALRPPFLA